MYMIGWFYFWINVWLIEIMFFIIVENVDMIFILYIGELYMFVNIKLINWWKYGF